MKELLIVDIGPSNGGVESLIYDFYRNVDKTKFKLSFLVYGDSCFHEDEYKVESDIFYLPKRFDHPIRHTHEMATFFKTHIYFDIVWVQSRSATNILAQKYAKKYTKAKVVTHSHSTGPENKGVWHKLVIKFLCFINRKKLSTLTDVAIGCSHEAYDYLFDRQYVGEHYIILNGCNGDKFGFDNEKRKIVRDSLQIGRKTFVIGTVGRLVPMKNQTFCIDILKEIVNTNNDAILIFVGDGPMRGKLEKYADMNGVKENVLFLGNRNDVSDIYNTFDAFVSSSSSSEGLPVVAIEAQMNGMPTFLSSVITKDAIANENAYRISLGKGASYWAKFIIDKVENPGDMSITKKREWFSEKMKYSKYEIKEYVKTISEILLIG